MTVFGHFLKIKRFLRKKSLIPPGPQGAPPLRAKFRKLSPKKLRDMHFRLFEPFLALFFNFRNKKVVWIEAEMPA